MSSTANSCAACGKEGDGLKKCNSCKEVHYCNSTCQRAHWPHHKKGCKRRAAELLDKALFKEHAKEDCPICCLPLPSSDQTEYKSCCGKVLCVGCMHGMMDGNADENEMFGACPFCRKPTSISDKEDIERLKKRMELNDATAFFNLGCAYSFGKWGLAVDQNRAHELWLKGSELGCAMATYNIGKAYERGEGVAMNKKKAKHYWEIAAMGGSLEARYDLACMEMEAGKAKKDMGMCRRALKHYMLAARAGFEPALEALKPAYSLGGITKDEYECTLRAYQESKDEMKSDTRDKAILMKDLESRIDQTQDPRELESIAEQLSNVMGIRRF